jgi:hypothetical protein
MFTQYEQFRRIAELSPRAAILEAWIDVEVAIYAAAKKAGLEVKGPANAYSLARNLVSLGKVPHDIMPFFEKLRRLRNNAAHLPDFVLDEIEANKYLDLALGANTREGTQLKAMANRDSPARHAMKLASPVTSQVERPLWPIAALSGSMAPRQLRGRIDPLQSLADLTGHRGYEARHQRRKMRNTNYNRRLCR